MELENISPFSRRRAPDRDVTQHLEKPLGTWQRWRGKTKLAARQIQGETFTPKRTHNTGCGTFQNHSLVICLSRINPGENLMSTRGPTKAREILDAAVDEFACGFCVIRG